LRDTQSLFAETLDGDQETSPAIFLIGWGNPTFDANYTMGPWFDDPVFQHFTDEELIDLVRQSNETPE
jgi:peptide/nickel transport system substrate-binding protein